MSEATMIILRTVVHVILFFIVFYLGRRAGYLLACKEFKHRLDEIDKRIEYLRKVKN